MPRSIGESYDRMLSDLRRTLGDTVADAEWTAGSLLTLDESLDFALGAGEGPSRR